MPAPTTFPASLRDPILGWYATQGRELAFRGSADPYAILVSEAMAQQTQAARAARAWIAFMARFPTVHALAAASPADVLRAWQGLGYNRRAVDLWLAAGRLVDEFGGVVPADLRALQSLPGVGPYTARAIGAIAFGMPLGAVDTNVRRVLGRIVAGAPGRLGVAELQRIADAAVPPDRPGAWTHALMDLGATLCRPREPRCEACPARVLCRYAQAPGLAARTRADRAGAERRDRVGGPGTRSVGTPFRSTSRWLRGRILDRLRDAADGDWVVLGGAIGEHDLGAVTIAAYALARDGLLELDPSAPPDLRARLPLGPR